VDTSEHRASLELHKFYRVLPDKDAQADGDMRIIDESGDDYLFPADYFIPIELPQAVVRALKSHRYDLRHLLANETCLPPKLRIQPPIARIVTDPEGRPLKISRTKSQPSEPDWLFSCKSVKSVASRSKD
jgi:hypothetical protein